METLEKEFIGRGEVRGFKFTQVQNNTTSYAYKVTTPSGKVHYEVFRKKVFTGFGSEKETYPTAKAFGVSAWWCSTPEQIQKLVHRIEELDALKQK